MCIFTLTIKRKNRSKRFPHPEPTEEHKTHGSIKEEKKTKKIFAISQFQAIKPITIHLKMATTTTKYQQLQQLMNRHLQSGTKTKSEFANFNLKVYLMCACIFWLGYRFSWLVCDLFLYGFGLYGAHIYIFISLLFIKIKRFYLLFFFKICSSTNSYEGKTEMKRVKKDMKQIMAAIIELFCFCATVTNTCHWFGLHKLALNVIIIARRVTFLLWCTKRKKNTFFEQKIKRESIDTKFGLNIVSYFWLFLCALTFRLIQKSLIHLITVRMHEYSPTIQFMFCDLCGSFLFKLV